MSEQVCGNVPARTAIGAPGREWHCTLPKGHDGPHVGGWVEVKR